MPLIALTLLLLFLALPLAEVAVFIKVGTLIGIVPTLALTILSAVAGTWLVRREGLATLGLAQASLERGELPVLEVISGAALVVAGFLLLTPGFLTDVAGFVLLLRPVRLAVGRAVMRRLVLVRGARPPGPLRPQVIEAEYSEVHSAEDRSPWRS